MEEREGFPSNERRGLDVVAGVTSNLQPLNMRQEGQRATEMEGVKRVRW